MTEYAVVNPATGETIKTYPTITDDALRDAIAGADEAHRTWSASSTVAERAALVRRVGELHTERVQHLAEIIVAKQRNGPCDTIKTTFIESETRFCNYNPGI